MKLFYAFLLIHLCVCNVFGAEGDKTPLYTTPKGDVISYYPKTIEAVGASIWRVWLEFVPKDPKILEDDKTYFQMNGLPNMDSYTNHINVEIECMHENYCIWDVQYFDSKSNLINSFNNNPPLRGHMGKDNYIEKLFKVLCLNGSGGMYFDFRDGKEVAKKSFEGER